MHAVWFSGPGGPEVLHWSEYADPSPGPGEVVLAAHATGVNYADPALAIAWPAAPQVISDRDRAWPNLAAVAP